MFYFGFVKVIYLPDVPAAPGSPQGVETIVNWRLEAGLDPIAEADRRGEILAILRVG